MTSFMTVSEIHIIKQTQYSQKKIAAKLCLFTILLIVFHMFKQNHFIVVKTMKRYMGNYKTKKLFIYKILYNIHSSANFYNLV